MIGNFKDPREDSRLHYGGGDAGQAIAAGLYVASNVFSWSEAREMPKRQADANKKVLELQKAHFDAIAKEKRDILRAGVGDWEANINAILDSADFQEAYAEVPRAAEYVPVDPCCEQGATIECNIGNVARADEFYRYVNRMHEQNDIIHVLSYDDCWTVNLDIHNQSIQNHMRGIMDAGSVVDTLTDNAEQAALTGRIGTTKKTTLRDLGISKERTKLAGRAEWREGVQWYNTVVSPLSRQGDIREQMLRPGDRIQLALQQAQLIQQSLQNKNNALAQKEPYLAAKLTARINNLTTKLQMKLNEAMLVNDFVPNYASIVAPNVSNTGQLFNILSQGVEHANRSWFYGSPAQAQDGYTGQSRVNQDQQEKRASRENVYYDK